LLALNGLLIYLYPGISIKGNALVPKLRQEEDERGLGGQRKNHWWRPVV
jgi:hypothetical protein